jgi:hypothetical protein
VSLLYLTIPSKNGIELACPVFSRGDHHGDSIARIATDIFFLACPLSWIKPLSMCLPSLVEEGDGG